MSQIKPAPCRAKKITDVTAPLFTPGTVAILSSGRWVPATVTGVVWHLVSRPDANERSQRGLSTTGKTYGWCYHINIGGVAVMRDEAAITSVEDALADCRSILGGLTNKEAFSRVAQSIVELDAARQGLTVRP